MNEINQVIKSRFQGDEAQEYDTRMPMLVAGYDVMHEIGSAYLRHHLPKQAKLLVVGAGTCSEIIKLAELQEQWQFLAVDLSQDMLDIGYQKLKQQGLESRVDFFCGDTSSLPNNAEFDAAISMLVMHFIEQNHKPSFLSDIKVRLKSQSPLVLADLMQTQDANFVDIQILVSHQLGVPFEKAQQIKTRFANNFKPLSIPDFKAMAEQVGFQLEASLFQSLGFYCWALRS